MKKSEQYHIAQMAVLNSPSISPERKLEIIETLLGDESLAKYRERREEEDDA